MGRVLFLLIVLILLFPPSAPAAASLLSAGSSGEIHEGAENPPADMPAGTPAAVDTPDIDVFYDESGRGNGDSGVAPDTLTIRVGYFGGDYTEKKTYTRQQLLQLPVIEQAYTWIDKMPAAVVNSVRGVKLKAILTDAGIDLNSIENMYFYCRDISGAWYQSYSLAYLFDTERYYYPNLVRFWDEELQGPVFGALSDAVPVEPVIAVADRWERFAEAPDFDGLNEENRFRLAFGQTDVYRDNAYRSARWIHRIDIMLGGTATGGAITEEMLKEMAGSIHSEAAGTENRQQAQPNSQTPAKAELRPVGKTGAGQAAAVQPWRIHEISEGAVPLAAPKVDKAGPYQALLFLALCFVGGVRRFRKYKQEACSS